MVAICFYFQVHQPLRLNKLRIFDINGNKKDYFNNDLNNGIFKKVSKNAYIPMNSLILDLINKTNGNFKVAFSLSGLSLKQMEEYHPETLISFLKLKSTNNVEFLNETYHHSLSSLFSEEEFHQDILKHKEEFFRIFEKEPKIFRNTELLYGDIFDNIISSHGFEGVIIDGNPILKLGKSPNFIYGKENSNLKLICKNCELSDDIAFRYGKSPKENLLKEIMIKINNLEEEGADLINFFMDYETFGEHFPKDSGIFDFFEELILELNEKEFEFLTPSEILEKYNVKENINLEE
ncbi:alpha-amylase, partial [bacterium]|nr:alpha-amylase [bacterium]